MIRWNFQYLLIILSFILCTSCSSTYFLSTIKTTSSDITQNENGDFFIKNDSLWIAYNFNGADAPIRITIFNKSKTPLYVDWQRSALILNDEAMSYAGNKLEFSADASMTETIDRYPYGFSYSQAQGNITGSVKVPSTTTFIPPFSMISQIPIVLNVNFKDVPKKNYKDAYLGRKDNEVVRIKRIDYTQDNTPLTFRSYLTVYFENGEPMVFEDEFYMSNLLKSTQIAPDKLPASLAERGDLFYVEKPANTTALQIIAGTAIVAGAIAVDVILDSDDYDY